MTLWQLINTTSSAVDIEPSTFSLQQSATGSICPPILLVSFTYLCPWIIVALSLLWLLQEGLEGFVL